MPEDWKRARREEFVEKIKEDARAGRGGVLYERYRKTGFESSIVKANFLAGLRDELLTRPEEKSFESYLEYRKVELPIA